MNIELIESQVCKVYIKLLTEEAFDVYGGTTKQQFSVSTTENGEHLVLIKAPSSCSCEGGRYDIFARRKSSGQEWLILFGRITTNSRKSSVGGTAVSPLEYHLDIPVTENIEDLEIPPVYVGIKGDTGYSTYDIACQQGFEGTEEEWLASLKTEYASEAVEAVAPYKEAAEQAAVNANISATDAAKSAQNASESASQAEEFATTASQIAQATSQSAAKAQQASLAAEQNASNAKAYLTAIETISADVNTSKEAAEAIAAEVAANAQEAAKQADIAEQASTLSQVDADNAQSAKIAAQDAQAAAEAAQAEAEAQATRAEEKADLLGDAALQGQNNTFEAGTTQTVNGIAVFNGDTVLNGECSGAAIDKQKAMAALQDLQGYKQCVYYHRGTTATSDIVTQVQPEIFSCAAKQDGEKAGVYYAESKDWRSTHACMLLRYDKTSPVEIIMSFGRDHVARPTRGNNLYARAWGTAGNSEGCFSSLFIEGTHVYVKQSHAKTQGHYSYSVYDLGVSDVLKNTNKLVWYLGDGFNTKIKMVVYGLVGNELQPVAVFNTGVVYSGATRLAFVLWGKATNVYAVRDETPELKNMVIEKNKAVSNKDFQLVNNDMPATSLQTVDATGGELVVTFAEAAGCGWTVERLPEWVTAEVTECENGGQIVLTIAPNESGAARTDYMLFKSVGNHAHGYPCTICNEIKQNA